MASRRVRSLPRAADRERAFDRFQRFFHFSRTGVRVAERHVRIVQSGCGSLLRFVGQHTFARDEMYSIVSSMRLWMPRVRPKPVALICRSGNRSGLAQMLLARAGFTKTVNVAGGMIAWRQAGLPVREGAAP